ALLIVVTVGVALVLIGRALFLLRLDLIELRLDLGLDLVAEVDVTVGLLALGRQAVAVPEVTQLGGGNAHLVSDPCVGAPLAHPGTNLVQLWSQRFPGHRRLTLAKSRFVPWHGRKNSVRYLFLG